MKIRYTLLRLIPGLLTAFIAAPVLPQEAAKQVPQDKASREKMMQQWNELSTPGENHKRLDPLAGKWIQVVKLRTGPNAKWNESRGSAERNFVDAASLARRNHGSIQGLDGRGGGYTRQC